MFYRFGSRVLGIMEKGCYNWTSSDMRFMSLAALLTPVAIIAVFYASYREDK